MTSVELIEIEEKSSNCLLTKAQRRRYSIGTMKLVTIIISTFYLIACLLISAIPVECGRLQDFGQNLVVGETRDYSNNNNNNNNNNSISNSEISNSDSIGNDSEAAATEEQNDQPLTPILSTNPFMSYPSIYDNYNQASSYGAFPAMASFSNSNSNLNLNPNLNQISAMSNNSQLSGGAFSSPASPYDSVFNSTLSNQDQMSAVLKRTASVEGDESDDEAAAENSHQELPDRNLFAIENHNSQLQAMQDLFERRQLHNHNPHNTHHHNQLQHQHQHHHQQQQQQQQQSSPLQSSQELNPISIGLDPSGVGPAPFNMDPSPFSVPNGGLDSAGAPPPPPHPHPHSRAGLAGNQDEPSLGPMSLSFGLNQLPHLLGFQSPPVGGFDQGAPPPRVGPPSSLESPNHLNIGSSVAASGDPDSGPQTTAGGQKIWPKIFRFTDGRINLSDFEKQKKIRLSSKNQHNGGAENHIDSAPIMFDGRQLKRKSFLILHGGIFAR